MAALKAVDHHGRSGAAGLQGASACGSGHRTALPAARLLGSSVTISAPPPAAEPWARPSAVSSAPPAFTSGASHWLGVTLLFREDAEGRGLSVWARYPEVFR